MIARILWNYFEAVKITWPIAWNAGGRGIILNKTNGFRALMRIFGPMYTYLAAPGEAVSSDQFLKIFKKTKTADEDFTIDNFPPGSSGKSVLTERFKNEFHLE